jgi:hypothetical protein
MIDLRIDGWGPAMGDMFILKVEMLRRGLRMAECAYGILRRGWHVTGNRNESSNGSAGRFLITRVTYLTAVTTRHAWV